METEVVEVPENVNERPGVGFPTQPSGSDKPKATKWIIAIIGVVVILILGVFFLLMSPTTPDGDASPTPPAGGLNTLPTSTPVPTEESIPSPSPEAVDKADVAIEILNGTGRAGDAGFLQGELEDLGFEDITAGNASSQNATVTTVTYNSSLSAVISDEITEKLEELYDEVEVKRISLTGDRDVEIITGPRKGSATTVPTATSTPTASPES